MRFVQSRAHLTAHSPTSFLSLCKAPSKAAFLFCIFLTLGSKLEVDVEIKFLEDREAIALSALMWVQKGKGGADVT